VRTTLAGVSGALVLLALAAPGAAAPRPTLVVTQFAPLTVTGAAFAPNERVVVTVVVGRAKHVRRVRAGAGGRFRARFEVTAALGCGGGLAVHALGAAGSKATAKLPRPQCPPD
jgi:hypothetical protein